MNWHRLIGHLPFRKKSGLHLRLEKLIHIKPVDIAWYEIALTHRSANLYQGKNYAINNERLEFLGDAILNAVIADFLFSHFPNEKEGPLTSMRAKIVSRHFMNDVALKLELNQLLKANTDRSVTGNNIYGNALEALIGAIYLDLGFKIASSFIVNQIIKQFVDLDTLDTLDQNFKGQIIDWAQKNHYLIEFKTEEAPESSKQKKVFLSAIFINNENKGEGRAETKKDAEQIAAREALASIKFTKAEEQTGD